MTTYIIMDNVEGMEQSMAKLQQIIQYSNREGLLG